MNRSLTFKLVVAFLLVSITGVALTALFAHWTTFREFDRLESLMSVWRDSSDIHRLNGVKNVLGSVVNGVAAALFAVGSLVGWHGVSWPHAAVMAVASILGSLGASHLARRLPARLVRRVSKFS